MSLGKDVSGFTLIELMMVVAIVAIIASIAYPSYQEQLRKSRRAEGRGLLLETAQALEKCKALYGAYNDPGCATLAEITDGSSIESTEGYYQVSNSGGVNTSTFLLKAIPVQPDPKCATLTLDQTGKPGKSGTGTIDDCW